MKLGAVIAAIRPTVANAVRSALREGFDEVVVVNDGVNLETPWQDPRVKYAKLGRNFGRLGGKLFYGQIATGVGMALAESDFVAVLGDDDEYAPGACELIREAIAGNPTVDIWIPGLIYNDEHTACLTPELLEIGNVSHPIYRPEIFASVPMYHVANEDYGVHDYWHVKRCVEAGFRIGWIGKLCVKIRPSLPGRNGRGA